MWNGMPALAANRFNRPVFGEPRMLQATPATRGGNDGRSMPVLAIRPLHGVLVRTTTQENDKPINTATIVPPPQAISEFANALPTFGLVATVRKLLIDKSAK